MVLGWRLKMAVIVNNMFRPQKTLKKRRRQLYSTLAFQVCYTVVKIGPLRKNRNRDEIYEKNNRIHLDRAYNKHSVCKGIKYKLRFGQNVGVQKKLFAIYKQNAS